LVIQCPVFWRSVGESLICVRLYLTKTISYLSLRQYSKLGICDMVYLPSVAGSWPTYPLWPGHGLPILSGLVMTYLFSVPGHSLPSLFGGVVACLVSSAGSWPT
jgi:hypothetical protein